MNFASLSSSLFTYIYTNMSWNPAEFDYCTLTGHIIQTVQYIQDVWMINFILWIDCKQKSESENYCKMCILKHLHMLKSKLSCLCFGCERFLSVAGNKPFSFNRYSAVGLRRPGVKSYRLLAFLLFLWIHRTGIQLLLKTDQTVDLIYCYPFLLNSSYRYSTFGLRRPGFRSCTHVVC